MTSKAVSKPGYHHGDLRTALVHSALALLEQEGAAALSMRAVARHAGVTAAAPYRHYQDRDALMSAVAAVGYRELAACLRGEASLAEALEAAQRETRRYAKRQITWFKRRQGTVVLEPDTMDTERLIAAATAQAEDFLYGKDKGKRA